VKVLLAHGANLRAGENRDDLWDAAVKSGNEKVLELLKAHGLKQPDQPLPPSEKDD